MVPIVERGRPLGPRITPRRVVHPDKGVVFGRVGDGQGEPFGFSTDAELVVTDVVRTADLRVLDALFATDPAESLRPCQRGACLIEPNSAWGYPMWIAVRVVDGHEYLAGWFPDFDPDPDGLRVPVLFDKWIAEIEAQWGVATSP